MQNPLRVGKEPLKVAVFYSSSEFDAGGESGGGVYEHALHFFLEDFSQHFDFQVFHFAPRTKSSRRVPVAESLQGRVFTYKVSFLEKILATTKVPGSSTFAKALGALAIRRRLKKLGVHMVYFLSPNIVSLLLEDIPYVLTVWDIGHRDLPGFPEVWSQSVWTRRENLFSTSVPRASFVFVDSAPTGQKLEKLYGLDPRNWHEIGLLHGLQVPKNPPREIEMPYIIYPSTRWPHKNHTTLIEALPKVLVNYPDLMLVLTGDDAGNGSWIREAIRRLEVEDSIIDLGSVSRERLEALIFWSEALVMPSLLGPTNIPPLEASAIGTRIIVSDAHGSGFSNSLGAKVVPRLDSAAWADAILEALNEESPIPSPVGEVPTRLALHLEVFRRLALERQCWPYPESRAVE